MLPTTAFSLRPMTERHALVYPGHVPTPCHCPTAQIARGFPCETSGLTAMRLQDRVAIVTGAASGIGRATAQLFAQEGAKVLAVDLPDKSLANAHVGNANIACLEKNLGDADAADRIIGTAIDRFGRLDIVMNNAGVAFSAPV